MTIALGADHGGFHLKEQIREFLDSKEIAYKDYGTFDTQSVDYPDIATKVCQEIVLGKHEKALLFCGTGIGICIAANKIKGIRAACCSDYFSAKYTRLHNDANVLCLGGRVVGPGLAEELVNVFLNTEYEGGRHAKRVEKIMDIEKE